jgi:hypothetical protein
VKGNYNVAKNRIEYKDEPANKLDWQKQEGQRINQFFGYQVLGFFDIDDFDENGNLLSHFPIQMIGEMPQPGDFRYADYNKDGVVDDRDMIAIGYSDIPEVIYGFSAGFSYRSFDFSVLFQGAYNVSLRLAGESIYEFSERGKVLDLHQGRWAYYEDPFTGEMIDTRATATYPAYIHKAQALTGHQMIFSYMTQVILKLRNIE